MRRLTVLFVILVSLILSFSIAAQDNATPYQIAFERIEEARFSVLRQLHVDNNNLTEFPLELGLIYIGLLILFRKIVRII